MQGEKNPLIGVCWFLSVVVLASLVVVVGVLRMYQKEVENNGRTVMAIVDDSLSVRDAVFLGGQAAIAFYNLPPEKRPNGGKISKDQLFEAAMRIRFSGLLNSQFDKMMEPYKVNLPQPVPDDTTGGTQ